MIRPRFSLVPMLFLMALLAACGVATGQSQDHITPSATPDPTSAPNVEATNDPMLPILVPAGPGGDAAMATGVLAVDGVCLYLQGQNADHRWLPVFPADTASWERDALVLQGQRFEIGERVSVGGSEAIDIKHLEFSHEPHDSCDVRSVWVVNPSHSSTSSGAARRDATAGNDERAPEEGDPAVIDYMTATGVDKQEAERRVALLDALDPTLAAIRGEAGRDLAGLWLEHKPDLGVGLRLTSEPSPRLQDIIEASPVPVTIHDTAAVSAAEARRRLQDASKDLLEAVPGLQGHGFDERAGEIVLHVFVDGGDAEAAAAARAGVEEGVAWLRQETGLPARVEYLSGPLTPLGS